MIRQLWQDQNVNHRGDHFAVEHLRLVERPASPPPIHVAASGKRSAALAGEVGDGIITVEPNAQLIDSYRAAGGSGPCLAQLHVSIADTMDDAVDNAWEWWPNGAIPPALLSELARPQHFEAIAATTMRDAIHETVVCATDAEPLIKAIDRYVGAGFDTVYLHQVGPDQARLAELARQELLPHYQRDV